MRKEKEKAVGGRFTESLFWKIGLYFWLVVCTVVVAGAFLLIGWFGSDGFFKGDTETMKRNMLRPEIIEHFHELCDYRIYGSMEEWFDALQQDTEDCGLYYNVENLTEGQTDWSNVPEFDMEDTVYTYTWTTDINLSQDIEIPRENVQEEGEAEIRNGDAEYLEQTIKESDETASDDTVAGSEIINEDGQEFTVISVGEYEVTAYAGEAFYGSSYGQLMELCDWLVAWRYAIIAAAIGGLVLVILNFVWILCLAGHRRGKEGITPSILNGIPLELLTVVMGIAALCGLGVILDVIDSELEAIFYLCVLLIPETVWCTLYCQELATRLKLGRWWKNTVLYWLFGLLGRALRLLRNALAVCLHELPYIWVVAVVVLVLSVAEFLCLCCYSAGDMLPVWFAEKLLICVPVFYCAVMQVRIRRGTRQLAEGDLTAKLDPKHMVLIFHDMTDDLNRIGDGLSVAVEKRMQSERLKTELITNVSHDIKTPLTSIINYASLCGEEAGGESEPDRAKLAEYSEVLLRQSQRLKKLLDDLIEASKATTGNLEVNLQPCELGVLLTQAAGEYEERLRAGELDLHIAMPEEPVRILADGRHLWRIFDNLLGNICKYAQAGSRVYLNMTQENGSAVVIFRNMSKYELNISAEELTERFVRGDSSRHMEGSGLGLSIAQSLVELQHGTMEIVTDGDLFKVVLRFTVIS